MQLDATTLHQMKPDNFMSAWSCIKFDVLVAKHMKTQETEEHLKQTKKDVVCLSVTG